MRLDLQEELRVESMAPTGNVLKPNPPLRSLSFVAVFGRF
jgi:hypothetical protein